MPDNSTTDQLETDQVFVDTQAFFRERFNWRSKSCARLKELVRSGQVQVLTTSVTRSEVRSKIKESLDHARAALRKHDVVLGQLGSANAVTALEAAEAETRLQALFDLFMDDVKAVEVPLSRAVDKIFDDYFHERPPFSAKKKSEFPDAFVVSSLQERARTTGKKIYVVSGDADMRACCTHAQELLIVEGLSEIISKATVTKTLHDSLLSFFKSSDYLKDKLTECLGQADIAVRGGSRAFARFNLVASGVAEVDEMDFTHLNVISQKEHRLLCELEFSASVGVWLEIEVETYESDGEDEHHWSDAGVTHLGYFNAEIDVQFDSNAPDEASFNHVLCTAEIEIDASEVDELRRYVR
jgi:hypothetical protein